MKSTIAIVASILAVLAAVMLIQYKQNEVSEHFTADGWVLNQPPEWFHKPTYNLNDWIVSYYPDQLAKPGGCDMHYRGDPQELNYLSSAYRFFRM